MELRQANYFVTVVKLRSFTKAAEQLRIAQPALGLQIRKLEAELGRQLLHRHSRGVEATDAGMVFLEHAQKLIEDIKTAKRAMVDFASARPEGTVSIGVQASLPKEFSGELARLWSRDYRGIFFKVFEEISNVIVDGVRDGRLDLGFAHAAKKLPGLSITPLMRERLYLVGAGRSRLESRDLPVTVQELTKTEIVLPTRPHGLRMTVEAAAEKTGATLSVPIEVQSTYLAKELVLQKIAHAVLPWSAVEAEVERGELWARPFEDAEFSFTIDLICREDRPLSQAARVAFDTIRALATKNPGTSKDLSSPAGNG